MTLFELGLFEKVYTTVDWRNDTLSRYAKRRHVKLDTRKWQATLYAKYRKLWLLVQLG